MQGIGDFFKRIRNIQAREIGVKVTIQQVVRKHIGIEVPLESISVASGVVTFGGISQAVRSELFIKKSTILAEIEAANPVQKIVDIR